MEVIEDGLWSFDNKPMVIRSWSAETNLERKDMAMVPIWIKFPYLKLHLWGVSVLSKMASVVGKPLFIDKVLQKRKG